MGKAAEIHASRLVKAEKRETKAREGVQTPAGQRRLVGILQFFTLAHRQPIDRFCAYCASVGPITLAAIDEMKLMYLPEHRNGVAGAIRGLIELASARSCPLEWVPAEQQSLLDASRRLEPAAVDAAVTHPGHVDYLWMQWMVGRKSSVLERVGNIATRRDPVGEQALSVIVANAHTPEVTKALEHLRRRVVRQATPIGIPHEYTPTTSIKTLRQAIQNEPLARQLVVWVGWLPERRKIVIATRDGERPAGVPEKWDDIDVVARKALPYEVDAEAKARMIYEEP